MVGPAKLTIDHYAYISVLRAVWHFICASLKNMTLTAFENRLIIVINVKMSPTQELLLQPLYVIAIYLAGRPVQSYQNV